MEKSLVDVPVLLMFFNNPARLQHVFERCRIARPSKLLLFQSGPRPGKNDERGIEECRILVQNVNWECEVFTCFLNENFGAAENELRAVKWAFSIVDRCIILEDDDVPSISFFQFCKELLDRYEYDTRISMIAGLNHEDITNEVEEDYFFTSNYSIWGWATWKRVVDNWSLECSFLDNEFVNKQLKNSIYRKGYNKKLYNLIIDDHKNGITNIESILIANSIVSSGYSIVPKKNMISNIGCDGSGENYMSALNKMPKMERTLFYKSTYEIDFPIKHPVCVIENRDYIDRVCKIMGWNHSLILAKRRLESLFLKLVNGDFNGIKKAIRKRLG